MKDSGAEEIQRQELLKLCKERFWRTTYLYEYCTRLCESREFSSYCKNCSVWADILLNACPACMIFSYCKKCVIRKECEERFIKNAPGSREA